MKYAAMPVAVVVLMLTACGGGGSSGPVDSTATCLNDSLYLVKIRNGTITGSSPGGVVFRLNLYPTKLAAKQAFAKLNPISAVRLGTSVVNWAGDPSGGLAEGDLTTIQNCAAG